MKKVYTQVVSVLNNPHRDYSGKQHTNLHCAYIDAQGTPCIGNICVQSILKAAGIEPKPGAVIALTIEVEQ